MFHASFLSFPMVSTMGNYTSTLIQLKKINSYANTSGRAVRLHMYCELLSRSMSNHVLTFNYFLRAIMKKLIFSASTFEIRGTIYALLVSSLLLYCC